MTVYWESPDKSPFENWLNLRGLIIYCSYLHSTQLTGTHNRSIANRRCLAQADHARETKGYFQVSHWLRRRALMNVGARPETGREVADDISQRHGLRTSTRLMKTRPRLSTSID
jgi:hypothetical protein